MQRRPPARQNAPMGKTRFVVLDGPAGRIEGILQGDGRVPIRRLAVICHPHPLGGGTMHTRVVHRTARALERAGHCVLRFNFRGVGASEGSHDQGRGEQDDTRAALAWLRSAHPGLAVTVAGFSFGSWVGLKVGCFDEDVDALVGIALPVTLFDFGFITGCAKRRLFLHGTADELAPFDALERLYRGLAGPKELVTLEGGSHLLTDHLDEVEESISAFASALPGPDG